MQSDHPLNLEILRIIGITDIGSRIAVLLTLDKMSGNLPRLSIRHQIDYERSKTRLVCCTYPFVGYSYIETIDKWLEAIGLKDLAPLFRASGFLSLDLLFLQMHSRYPLNEDILAEVGVTQTEHQQRILSKLREDTQVYIGSNLVVENTGEALNCSCSML